MNTDTPGYWRDSAGSLIPESKVKAVDKVRNQVVEDLIDQARVVASLLSSFKARAFSEVATFIELSGEQYGAKLRGVKGNITLMTFDGRYKIIRQIQDHLVFDERLQAAKQLIDECIQSWTAGSSDEIKALINNAFQVNKEGQINTGRVLGLRRLDINDAKWKDAMTAISDSVQVAGSKPYIRFYERVGETDEYRPISLDMASA